jgi:hypothetical protein
VRKKQLFQNDNDITSSLHNDLRLFALNTAIAETYKKIEESVSFIDELTQKSQQDGKHLETEKVVILTEYEAINKNVPLKVSH